MNDAYVCDAIRTPIGRYGGALSSIRADDLAAIPIRALIARNPSLDTAAIDEVLLGCANQAGEDNRNVARMAALLAGLPTCVPGGTINRLCGSGLDAVGLAARTIRAGEGDVMITGGVESMSRAPFVMGKADAAFSRGAKLEDTTMGWRFVNPRMQQLYGTDTMPETAENVAVAHGIMREEQDRFALSSQDRAARAQANGRFVAEIVGITLPQRKGDPVRVENDEHLRATTMEALARLRPVVHSAGTVTAGNASGINDGAAALILASERGVKDHGLTPRARIIATATSGVDPRIMGMGPVTAVQKLLAMTGVSLDAIDLIELNEAFAAQAIAVLRALDVREDDPRVNPNGGAIALGHPLGMSGARLAMTCVEELDRTKGKYAIACMCVGVGQGIAQLIERV